MTSSLLATSTPAGFSSPLLLASSPRLSSLLARREASFPSTTSSPLNDEFSSTTSSPLDDDEFSSHDDEGGLPRTTTTTTSSLARRTPSHDEGGGLFSHADEGFSERRRVLLIDGAVDSSHDELPIDGEAGFSPLLPRHASPHLLARRGRSPRRRRGGFSQSGVDDFNRAARETYDAERGRRVIMQSGEGDGGG
ncbi:hypothetical protein BD626DRAFT_633652 [Schizophyllum amplum]|uniref:Uncharacterized protein n=1 Tax=Schizophyllum amplum TaxID=97359 RepID=A0A550C237_9AGAR|nr:hypothetical protein BD626DRAFT_633652 [Auriculariopsis ampla]